MMYLVSSISFAIVSVIVSVDSIIVRNSDYSDDPKDKSVYLIERNDNFGVKNI